MRVLEGAAYELDEGLHPAVHHEQADVGRLVVHADSHELQPVVVVAVDVEFAGGTNTENRRRVRTYVGSD